MTDMLRELYQETILDHNKRPRNKRVIENASAHANGFNPLCGDKVSIYLTIDNDVIKDVSFEGVGCAISTASASLLTEILVNKSLADAETLFQDFHLALTDDKASAKNLGKLTVLAGVKEFPARVKCATLAWHTFQAALHHQAEPITTE